MSWEFGEDEARLSDDDLAIMERVLGDGFTSFMLFDEGPDWAIPSGMDEPFWSAPIRASLHVHLAFEEFANQLRPDGFTDAEIADRFMEWQEERRGSAPAWIETNPFSFDLEGVKDFIKYRCQESLGGDEKLLVPFGGELHPREFVLLCRPYSMPWVELHILEEIMWLSWHHNSVAKGEDLGKASLKNLLDRAALVGRMFEYYRWRFHHGADALRGKKVENSARSGGLQKGINRENERASVLGEMRNLIERGLSISRAADLASKRGFGRSADANRRLWHRNAKK